MIKNDVTEKSICWIVTLYKLVHNLKISALNAS